MTPKILCLNISTFRRSIYARHDGYFLNLGLNDKTVEGMIKKTKIRDLFTILTEDFVQMYGDVVLDLKPTDKHQIDPFEEIIERKKKEKRNFQ